MKEDFSAREENFMQQAIRLSQSGMQKNEGGPFGCVIVQGDKIIGQGNNQVICTNDPTAHAEIVAIRNACKNLGTYDLVDCELYTSCEPCPMCLAAIYWARLKIIYYGNTSTDAANIGFDDAMIYEEMKVNSRDRKIPLHSIGREAALAIFAEWQNKMDKTRY